MSRLIAIALPCALCACASDAASRAELAALRHELAAIRRDQTSLEQRLERIETIQAVSSSRRSPQKDGKAEAPPPKPPASAAQELPSLTVVKLHPKADPAPKIDTTTQVVEPPPDVVAELASPPPSRASEPEEEAAPAEPAGVDREFDQALEALRTGNLEGGVQAFLRFADAYPKNSRADNALYFAAFGLLSQEDPARAAQILERLVSDYPAGDAVQDGMLKLAECRTKLKQADEARRLYHLVIETYPGTAAASQAEARLASLRP